MNSRFRGVAMAAFEFRYGFLKGLVLGWRE